MAKIVEVRASAHSCPLDNYLVRLGLGTNTKRDIVLVRITDESGAVGLGEAHHGQNPTAMATVVQDGLGSLIIGADPLDSEGIWHRLERQQIVTHGLGAGSITALAGIDNALWDLKGKLLGQPVYRLLGGSRKRIRAYAGGLSLGFKPPEELEKEVAALVAEGYTAIKMRVGDHPARDAERVGYIRRTFGDDLDIAVDAATRYDLLDIPEVLRYCEENRVYWLGGAVHAGQHPGLCRASYAHRDPHRRRREPLREAGLPRALRGAGDLYLPGGFLQIGRAQRAQEDFGHGCCLAYPDGAAYQPQHPERRRQCASAVCDPERADLRGRRGGGEPVPHRSRQELHGRGRRPHRAA